MFFGLAHDIVGYPESMGNSFIPKAMVAYPETMGELGMFTTKLNLVAPLAFAVLGVTRCLDRARARRYPVPAPLLGAGLPALAILAGGYWLIRKFRERR